MRTSFKLAISYLKKQKGRSLALITSIMLAVTLVFTLNVIPESKSKHDIKEAYKNYSDYHVEYSELNTDTINKLKSDKSVKEIHDIVNLGNVISKEGVSISLNSYSEDFIKSYGYTLIKGDAPSNENEIVLEEKALKEMGLSSNIGQSIDFNIVKKYIDDNNENQVYSKNKSFKLVGIVQKPEGYYKDNLYYKVKGFTYYDENKSLLPKELITHNGVLNFATSTPSLTMTNKAIGKYKLNDTVFTINIGLREAIENYNMDKDTKFSKNNKLIPMIAATLVIYNIFNIILVDMTKQIGMLRAVGMPKKNIRLMIGIKSLIVLILGLIIGFVIGIIVSYIGLYSLYKGEVAIYISKESITEPMIMAVIAVVIASIFNIYKAGKISPIEAIRATNASKKSPKNKLHYKLIRKLFGISGEMAYKSMYRYKARAILSILSISIAGSLFIQNMVIYSKEDSSIDKTSMSIMTMGESDIILDFNGYNSDVAFNGYGKNEIDKISNVDGVSKVNATTNLPGYLNSDVNNLSEDVKMHIPVGDNNQKIEVPTLIKAYKDDDIKDIEKYIETDGKLDYEEDGILNAVISNHFYSNMKASNDVTTLKNIKVGDIIDIKLLVNIDNKIEYINQKIRVVGLLDKEYVIKADGGMNSYFQVLLKEEDFKSLTKKSNFNRVSIKLENENDEKVITEVEDIIKNNSFENMESKYGNRNYYKEQYEKNKNQVLVSVILTLLISSINIICIIKTNIMTRINEISTLRAIGMSMKNVKSMIMKESIIYAITSTLVAAIVASYNYYKCVEMENNIFSQGLGIENITKFSIPTKEIIIFFIATLAICLLAGYISSSKVKKLSIVEGLRNNE